MIRSTSDTSLVAGAGWFVMVQIRLVDDFCAANLRRADDVQK
jgi:hypothetical protein